MTNTDLLTFTPLHRTFGALRTGGSGDLTHPTPELAAAIKSAIAKYGVLVFRATGLDDDSHVALSRLLGELDDVTPYNKLGRINRLKYDELFDVSNIESDGSVVAVDSMRAVFGRGEFTSSDASDGRKPAVRATNTGGELRLVSTSTRRLTPAARACHFS